MPQIDTIPLCGVFNAHGCAVQWNVTGNTYFGDISNCDSTVTLPGLGNIKLMLFDSTGTNLLQQVYSNGDGGYSFNTNLGKYIIKADTSGTPFYVLCPDSNALHLTISTNDSLDYGVNLRLGCKNGYDVGVNSIDYSNGKFFPGRSATVNIQAGDFATYYGVTCNTAGLAGTVQAIISGPVNILSASGNGVISGSTITWNVSDFSVTNFTTGFNTLLSTNNAATAGDHVCINVTVTANSGIDNNPSNNNLSQCFTVVASHDPNFKEVYPSTIANAGDWLTYTIHFQNTGSAPAQNIYVLDTIDNNLDISTLQVIAESKKALIQGLPGRIVRFSFPDIFLPDSLSSTDSSIAYIQYRIKTISGIASNTTINNTAAVYFDNNVPILTNNATSTFDISTGTKELTGNSNQVTVYPNPTNGLVNIVLASQCYECTSTINITDILGSEVISDALISKQTTVDLSSMASGVYFIRISTASATQTLKVVKE
jgi:uncharacterized repeat protein (TIGR01451 family)